MKKIQPQIKMIQILYKERNIDIEFFYREGKKQTILFVHGLGGAKENYWEACKSNSLDDHTLIGFDNPGTGNSTYYDDSPFNVDDLVAITDAFIEALKLHNFILCGTSMGGLTTMLYLNGAGRKKVKAYINIEGNLMPEDCMFSRKVVTYDFETFRSQIFARTIHEMRAKGNAGYHIIANNLQLNTNIKSYFHYSFQTVQYSATGELLKQFLKMDIPRIFIYGSENRSLSYIPQLRSSNVPIQEIPNSNHFVFYDNPKDLYDAISSFIDSANAS
jgi:pimeloyl-ACP methyl ester carboxylesterase